MRSIAIIPARAGSKRIPGKNVKAFEGQPIVRYAIDAALESGVFDVVMTSTDSPEVAGLAQSLGAEVPFLRSAANSDDHATTAAVLGEVIEGYRKRQQSFELGCCIYPCNPFLTAERLRLGQKLLLDGGFDSVFSAVRYQSSVLRAFVAERDRLRLLFPEYRNTRSQDLPPVFRDAAQLYWFRVDAFLTHGTLWTENTGFVEVQAALYQDIDTEEDWALAESKYRLWKSGEH